MKLYQVLLLVIVVVLINNVFLLSYLSNEAEPIFENTSKSSELKTRSTRLISQKKFVDRPIEKKLGVAGQTEQQSDTRLRDEISEAIRQYLRSGEFKQELNNYQTEFAYQFEEVQSRLDEMSDAELYSVALDSTNPIDQNYAKQLLIQNGFGGLDTEQLKTLYLSDDEDSWAKESLLIRLLEDEDAEAIGWAKQFLVEGSNEQFHNSGIYSAIYDADPGFIKQHFRDMDLNSSKQGLFGLAFILQDSELSKSFYQENFDKLLDAKNNKIFEYLSYPAKLGLSNQQQSSLSELFDSDSRQRREFAINQVRNIEDINVLRDAYSRLTKNSEKLSFLRNLSGGEGGVEIATLVRELAAASDDARIREFINQ